ncbi:MAG: GNAT family N-acetyltransferase [Corynebacteriales bacterium]|nr:GNAT family N-acetyltransferase [Mycobacteriales bacterium]
MHIWFDAPTLTGRHVRLEPLSLEHADELHEAAQDPDMWTYLSSSQPRTVEDMRESIHKALTQVDRVAWAQINTATGKTIGTTSYYEIEPEHRSLYIGYTWLSPAAQRTGINTEAKLMLLTRAFDELDAVRVGWHTDARNTTSQRAIERLGAKKEGLLRSHRLLPNGTHRDTVVYSVIGEEWPRVRDALLAKLRS